MTVIQHLVFWSLALFAFSNHAAYAYSGRVSGTVIKSSGAYLRGAKVTIGSRSAISDSRGRYKFSKIASGKKVVRASKSGYKSTSVFAEVEPKRSTKAPRIVMKRPSRLSKSDTRTSSARSGDISGIVTAGSGTSLSGAKVIVGNHSTKSDSLGRYKFSKIPMGTRTVIASKSSYKTTSVSINVRSKTTVKAPNIVLQLSEVVTPLPTVVPVVPTSVPTLAPTSVPPLAPTIVPTRIPTIKETVTPTAVVTVAPTRTPTPVPPSTIDLPAIPNLVMWESAMKTYGAQHCNALRSTSLNFDSKLASTYYDAEWVFYNIFDYTKDNSWLTCAQNAEAIYRDQYAVPANGNVPGYWNFSRGLTEDFLRTGDMKSRDAVVNISKNGAFGVDGTPLSATSDSTMSREVAYNMMSYMNAETVGQPRRSRLMDLKNQAVAHMNQWFVTKNAPYIRPFMVSLTSHALIEFDNNIGDPKILPLIKTAADFMWREMWLVNKQAFQYTNVDTALFSSSSFAYNTGGKEPAPDLNLLIAPIYAWLYHQTGELKYINQADAIFNGGVTQAYLVNGKQFNQNYRLSFEYIKWRKLPPLVAVH